MASDTVHPATAPDTPLDMREQLARIDRTLAENAKLQAETRKLFAEARKFNRDPWFVALAAIFAAIAARLPEILKAFGVGS